MNGGYKENISFNGLLVYKPTQGMSDSYENFIVVLRLRAINVFYHTIVLSHNREIRQERGHLKVITLQLSKLYSVFDISCFQSSA